MHGRSPRDRERAMSGALLGRRALITGAGRGIGRAVAVAMAAAGAEVTLVARTVSDLEESAALVRAIDENAVVAIEACDVTDDEAVSAIVDARPTHDVIVNAAGGNRPQRLEQVDMATFDALFALNVRGTFSVIRHAVRRLRADGVPGVIINVSSQMGHVGAPTRVVYCGTKHAVEGLTKALAVELAPEGIRVVAIAPTFVDTPMTRPYFTDPAFRDAVLGSIPMGRLATVEEVAAAAVFLASDGASIITGTSLLIDGGWTAR
jgi:NAD(P)-dependent dehydrogenase (short-subunit alcohol dehydrogenase family)